MPELSPDEVAAHAFSTSFRGLDPHEVRTFLARVAERLRSVEAQAQELASRVADAEQRAAHPEMDVDTLTSALGDETARILRSAQDAAADIRGKAEENVAQLLREAYEEAARIRAEAESVLARETETAEAAAADIRSSAEADAAAALGRARQEAERLLADVESRARTMVEEAQASRTRILTDLARRRKLAHTQVEQLRAGRERLLEAYRLVRSTLDEVTDELVKAEGEARAAAEAAARKLSDEPVEGDALDVGAEAGEGGEGAEGTEGEAADDVGTDPDQNESAAAAAGAPVVHAPTAEASRTGPAVDKPIPSEPPAGPRVAVAPPLPEPDERRLSSLRIIRRPKAEAPVEAEAAPEPAPPPEVAPAPAPPSTSEGEPDGEASAGFTPVAPATAGEGVRIIKAPRESRATVDPPLPEETAAAEPDEPPEVVEADAAGTAEEPPSDAAGRPPAGSVDDLFARIRADREQEVAKAREVLDEPGSESAAGEAEADKAEDPGTAAEPEAPQAGTSGDAPVSDADEALLQRRDRVVEDIEHRLARRLKRALQDEQNDVLDRFRSAKGRPAVDAVLPPAAEHPGRYRTVAAELLYEAARAGTAFVDDLKAKVSVDDLAEGLAADLVTPLRRRLERGFEEGADEDSALIVERIGAAYRESKGKRIEQLAADHVIAAFSRGTFLATAEGAPLRWIVDDVGGPCPDCDDNALAGPTPRGEEYPTGRLHPPAHAGCRCLLAPAVP